MAYGDFTLEVLEEKFGLKNKVVKFFPVLPNIKPSVKLQEDLAEAEGLPTRTEKYKSEAIVFPLLKELRRTNSFFFTIYSGENLNVDVKRGLKGECDFILSKDIGTYTISYPIMQILEAKKGDIDLGIPQCAAQMLGAKTYNEQKGTPLECIYGCVTTGREWKFLKLSDKIYIDSDTYTLKNLEELLAAFQFVIDFYRNALKDIA
jgi:hypothetical protein